MCILRPLFDYLSECCTLNRGQNPDSNDPPAPIRPIPLAKLAKRAKNAPPPQSQGSCPAIPLGDPNDAPGRVDILRYRHHYGTNLGGCFVLEKWLHPSMFIEEAARGSELDAVFAYVNKYGEDAARVKWEVHWANALKKDEIDFLVQTGVTTVRLPIGHYVVGPGFCYGTPFGSAIAAVYKNAWLAVKALCARLYANGIGILIDLHALPFGANKHEHSGTSSGVAGFWKSQENLEMAARCLQYIAHEIFYGHVVGCIGLQICNEAEAGAKGMYGWYKNVVIKLSNIDATLPLYMSDGWLFKETMNELASLSLKDGRRNPIIVDTHKYYAFDPTDRAQGPTRIISRIPAEADEMRIHHERARCNIGPIDFIVGEYSCVLDPETWAREPSCDRDDTCQQFGQTQCARWQTCGAGGTFFWTAKMDWMDGGEWGFFDMSKRGFVQAPPYMHWGYDVVRAKNAEAQRQRYYLRNNARMVHEAHWESVDVREEPERFELGWDKGFSDAAAFFLARAKGNVVGARTGGDKIGFLALWTHRRSMEFEQEGEFAWRWRHGFRDGVQTYERFVEI